MTSRTAVAPSVATASCARLTERASCTAGEPPDLLAALRVELRHVAGEVREREVAVLVDDRADLLARACPGVVVTGERRHIGVGAAAPLASEQALVVEPVHHGHHRG